MNSNPDDQKQAISSQTKLTGAITWLRSGDIDQAIAVIRDNGEIADADFPLILSQAELHVANTLSDQQEKRHFLMRRAFQRGFVGKCVDWHGNLADLPLCHRRDTRPTCPTAPELCISFSSSGDISLASSHRRKIVGVDIEHRRPVINAIDLSRRFFTESETLYLSGLPENLMESEFLTFWAIKEACLKAIGKGIIFGLNSFTIAIADGQHRVSPPPGYGSELDWSVETLDIPRDYIAMHVKYGDPGQDQRQA
jgi:4'-phosphopantetheinyl transferase